MSWSSILGTVRYFVCLITFGVLRVGAEDAAQESLDVDPNLPKRDVEIGLCLQLALNGAGLFPRVLTEIFAPLLRLACEWRLAEPER